ncbi:hypothetical protein KCP74_16970 [Salmonella enterica subsp. enterica]|nr:hypothetical protein KCP74_16970 [Salmonella enterica subsp. enterica]
MTNVAAVTTIVVIVNRFSPVSVIATGHCPLIPSKSANAFRPVAREEGRRRPE